jgi:hypothetical protein
MWYCYVTAITSRIEQIKFQNMLWNSRSTSAAEVAHILKIFEENLLEHLQKAQISSPSLLGFVRLDFWTFSLAHPEMKKSPGLRCGLLANHSKTTSS